jgi:hypothetical protein
MWRTSAFLPAFSTLSRPWALLEVQRCLLTLTSIRSHSQGRPSLAGRLWRPPPNPTSRRYAQTFLLILSQCSCSLQVSLELGGKSPHLIFESADLDQAANWSALGIFYNTGQDCTAGSRVYVQESIYDKFVALLVEKAKQLKIGDGFDEANGGGPVVSKTQVCFIFDFVVRFHTRWIPAPGLWAWVLALSPSGWTGTLKFINHCRWSAVLTDAYHAAVRSRLGLH